MRIGYTNVGIHTCTYDDNNIIFLSFSLTLTYVWWQIMYARSPTCTLLPPPPFPRPTAIFQRVRVGLPRFTYASVTVWAIFQTSVPSAKSILYSSHIVLRLGIRYTSSVFLAIFDWLPAGHSGSISGSPADVNHACHTTVIPQCISVGRAS